MEALEMSVYVFVAVLVGGALLMVLFNLNTPNMTPDDTRQLKQSELEFLRSIEGMWQDCDLGTREESFTVYIEGNGNLSRQELQQYLLKHNVVEPKEEDINMTNLILPTIVVVRCSNGTMSIG